MEDWYTDESESSSMFDSDDAEEQAIKEAAKPIELRL